MKNDWCEKCQPKANRMFNILFLMLMIVILTMLTVLVVQDTEKIGNMWSFHDLCIEADGIPLETHVDGLPWWVWFQDNYDLDDDLDGCYLDGETFEWRGG